MMNEVKGRSGISEMKSPVVERELQAGAQHVQRPGNQQKVCTLGENQESRVEKRE